VTVKGPRAAAHVAAPITVGADDGTSRSPPNDERREQSLHGRPHLIANMVTGSPRLREELEIVGVGYRVLSKGRPS
jgi:ribosomal protein L6P/L9E